MRESDFQTLRVKSAVCPAAESWPKPDFSKMTLGDDGVARMGEVGDVHWSHLADAVKEARDRTLKTLGSISAIDSDKALSSTGKAEHKRDVASKALAALEKSESLTKARASVERQVAHWNKELTPKPPDASTAMLHCEIRAFLASLKAGERVAFINSNLGDPVVAAAVIGGPCFLSGLSPTEMAVVRQRVEASANPEISKVKAETVNALADVEKGWRNAAASIRAAGGLEKSHDGAEKVAE